MTVFLSVLKWIGWILLFFLAFIIIVLLYLLLLPLHYHVWVRSGKEEKVSGEIRAYGFLHFWQMAFLETDDEYQLAIYAFWGKCKVYPLKKKQKTSQERMPEEDTSILDEEDIQDILLDKEVVVDDSIEQKKASQKAPPKEKTKKKTKKQESLLKDFHKKWKDEHNRNAVLFFIKKVLWLMNKTKPKILHADVDFALGDPALTGIATGIISLCPASYGKKTRIVPDFESNEIYVYGWIEIKGIVFLSHIVYLIISIIFNKDVRTFLKS